jgi:hypothetical protein
LAKSADAREKAENTKTKEEGERPGHEEKLVRRMSKGETPYERGEMKE